PIISRDRLPAPPSPPRSGCPARPSMFPDLFPPRACGSIDVHAGFLPNVLDAPPCERREPRDFLRVPLFDFGAIRRHRRARLAAGPRVTQHIASLEVGAIGRLLKHEVLGEMRAIVADV